MISYLFFGLLGALGLTYVFVGRREAKKMEANNEGYFLGGKSLGIFSLTLTLLATQFGGGSLVGAAEEAYSKGWIVLFYPAGICFGFLVLALGVGSRLRKMGLSTVAEIFEKAYKAPVLRKVASLISIGAMFFILVGQGVAARKLFGSLGYESSYLFLGFWGLIILYTVMGGLKAVVNTDVIKMVFIIIVLVGVTIAAQMGLKVIPLQPHTITAPSGSIPWVAWFLMPMLFMVFEQDMAQRCFAAKSGKAVTLAFGLASGLLFLCSLFGVYFGIMANRMGLELTAGKGILIEVISRLTSPVTLTFFLVAFVMVILSTADSLLCSVASNLAYDFPIARRLSEKKKVFLSQAITCVVGLAAMSLSLIFDNILTLLITSYEFSVVTLFFPVTAALFLKRPDVRAAITSMVLGALGFVAFRVWEVPFPKEVICLVLSGIGFWAAQFFLSRKSVLQEVS